MLKTSGQGGILPVQVLSGNVGTPLPPGRQAAAGEGYGHASHASKPGRLDLHSDLPPELFSIPQMMLGTFTAVASYGGGRRRGEAPEVPVCVPSVPEAPAEKEKTTLPVRRAEGPPAKSMARQGVSGAGLASGEGTRSTIAASAEASVAWPGNEPVGEWPVYYVDEEEEPKEPIDVTPLKPAEVHCARPPKQMSVFERVLQAAKGLFCDVLAMAPYTAAICMNILA